MSASKKRKFQDLEYNFKNIHKYVRQIASCDQTQVLKDETDRLNEKLKRCKEREKHNEKMRLEIVAEKKDTEDRIKTTRVFMTHLKIHTPELLRVTRELAIIVGPVPGGSAPQGLQTLLSPRVWGFCKFTGVYWDKSNGEWHAQIFHEGKTHYIGRFKVEVEAAKAWDAKARSLRGASTVTNFNLDGSPWEKKKKKKTSKFIGVAKGRSGKWQARISHEGKQHSIGHFEVEVEAAKAYDAKARSLRGAAAATNFNLDGSDGIARGQGERDCEEIRRAQLSGRRRSSSH